MQIQIPQPAPGEVLEVHIFEFACEADLIEAKRLIDESKQSGSTGPIVLPNGEQIHLLPHEKWLYDQIMRLNYWLLIFNIIR